jgi:hypothetical protein
MKVLTHPTILRQGKKDFYLNNNFVECPDDASGMDYKKITSYRHFEPKTINFDRHFETIFHKIYRHFETKDVSLQRNFNCKTVCLDGIY